MNFHSVMMRRQRSLSALRRRFDGPAEPWQTTRTAQVLGISRHITGVNSRIVINVLDQSIVLRPRYIAIAHADPNPTYVTPSRSQPITVNGGHDIKISIRLSALSEEYRLDSPDECQAAVQDPRLAQYQSISSDLPNTGYWQGVCNRHS